MTNEASPTIAEAFLDPAAQDLFASVAAFGDARELAVVDVASAHAAARLAMELAIANALHRNRSHNPGVRIALVKGDAGSGKSHVVTTTLRRVVSTDEVYPAVLQLTAPVDRDGYDAWLLDAVFRQFAARHFADGLGRSPLRRLAESLLDRVDPSLSAAFAAAVDDLDNDDEFDIALRVGRRLRAEAERRLPEDPPAEAFFGALILAGFGRSDALSWFRTGRAGRKLRDFDLPDVATAADRMGVLRDLGLAAQVVGAAIVLAFDQVENLVKLGSESLLAHALVRLVRIAEDVPNCAVIVSALGSAYDDVVSGLGGAPALPVADRDRIEREEPLAVTLGRGPADFYRAVVAQRLAVLAQRIGCPTDPDPLAPLPGWLISGLDAQFNVRGALREVARYRAMALDLGRPPSEQEFAPSRQTDTVIARADFDKEWADFQDASSASQRLLNDTKADLVAWWVDRVGHERDGRDTAHAGRANLADDHATPIVEVELRTDGEPTERRRLALCEAANRNRKLASQIEGFLAVCDGTPFILRTNGFPKGRTTQVAPSLRTLEDLFGTKLDLNDVEWTNLACAREFCDARDGEAGFPAWQREKQWLTQLLAPLQPLIATAQAGASGASTAASAPAASAAVDAAMEAPAPAAAPDDGVAAERPFPVVLGASTEGGAVRWDPYRAPPDHLNNFSFLVTGDAGSGKTQTIRVLIDAACRAGLAVTIFDFKADYCDAAFAEPLGIEVVDVRGDGLPFNPLEPPPRGASGVQPIEHAYEVAGILKRVFRLGDIQEGALRDAISRTYADAGIDAHEWIDPRAARWPSFDGVLARLRDDPRSAALVTRLSVLEALGLFPGEGRTGASFEEFLSKRVCLRLSDLPTDEVKSALAEILIVQLHGYALRREQPRRLVHMMVFDEAHRVKDSKRLETLAREGRAFGVGIVLGTQFPGDVPETMAGNLATQLALMNNQAGHRRTIVAQLLGTTATPQAKELLRKLSALRPLEGLFSNAHHNGVLIRVEPHHRRLNGPACRTESARPADQ